MTALKAMLSMLINLEVLCCGAFTLAVFHKKILSAAIVFSLLYPKQFVQSVLQRHSNNYLQLKIQVFGCRISKYVTTTILNIIRHSRQ